MKDEGGDLLRMNLFRAVLKVHKRRPGRIFFRRLINAAGSQRGRAGKEDRT